jgi:hypothetical protein
MVRHLLWEAPILAERPTRANLPIAVAIRASPPGFLRRFNGLAAALRHNP